MPRKSKLFFNGVEKQCSECLQVKPLVMFRKRTDRKSGMISSTKSRCWPCERVVLSNQKNFENAKEGYWECEKCLREYSPKRKYCLNCTGVHWVPESPIKTRKVK